MFSVFHSRPSDGAGGRGLLQPPSRTGSEAGFALVEVLVSSALLVLIALGIYTGIDGASGISGVSKARSIATSLAQQDLDRVRGLRASELATLDETNTKTAGGLSFTVASTGAYVSDSSGTTGTACAPAGSTLHYIRASSKVTWPRMGAALPVQLDTLIPVGGQGNLAVSIHDRAGTPISAQSVTASGPGGTTRTVPTTSAGCAFFGFLPLGSYTYSFSRPGYVDTLGTASVSKAVAVNPGGTVDQDVGYDLPGQIRATFETVRAGATTGSTVTAPAEASALYVEKHPGSPSGTWVPSLAWPVTPAAGSITTTKVFYPFPTPYAVWAGNCTSNQPTGASYGATVAPGASPADVTVRVPAVNVNVTNSSNVAVSGATVKITPTADTSGCVGTPPGAVTQSTTAASTGVPAGALPKPAFPWGTYDVCAQLVIGKNTWRTTVAVANTNAAGTAVQTIKVTNASPSVQAACP